MWMNNMYSQLLIHNYKYLAFSRSWTLVSDGLYTWPTSFFLFLVLPEPLLRAVLHSLHSGSAWQYYLVREALLYYIFHNMSWYYFCHFSTSLLWDFGPHELPFSVLPTSLFDLIHWSLLWFVFRNLIVSLCYVAIIKCQRIETESYFPWVWEVCQSTTKVSALLVSSETSLQLQRPLF